MSRQRQIKDLEARAEALYREARVLRDLDEEKKRAQALAGQVPLLQKFEWLLKPPSCDVEGPTYFHLTAIDTNDKAFSKASDALHKAFGFGYHGNTMLQDYVSLQVNDFVISLVIAGTDKYFGFLALCPLRVDTTKATQKLRAQAVATNQLIVRLGELNP